MHVLLNSLRKAYCRVTAGTVLTCQIEEVALRPECIIHITIPVHMVAPLQNCSSLAQQGALGARKSWLERL